MSVESAISADRPESPGCVLLVDTDLFFSARILSVLEKSGYSVRTAVTRPAAEDEVTQSQPKLVILNLASPALGGTGLIRRVKELAPATKVLAFLSHTKIPDVREEVLAAGADRLCANSAVSMRLPAIVRETLAGEVGNEEE